jgi:hypothetical protein
LHPGPVVLPVRLAHGHRATTGVRWVSGPVYSGSRKLEAVSLSVSIGSTLLRAPLAATLYGPAGKPAPFDQSPLRAAA